VQAAREASAYSQSLERGLAVLSAFRSGRPLLGVSELGREVGLSRSTTHRYVATLATLGYLQQDDATKKYRLGPRVLDLGFSAIHSMELREISAPHLQKLRRRAALRQLGREPHRVAARVCGGEQLLGTRLGLVSGADPARQRVRDPAERARAGGDLAGPAGDVSLPGDRGVALDARHSGGR